MKAVDGKAGRNPLPATVAQVLASASHGAGGVGAAVLPLARELAERGVRVEIIAAGRSDESGRFAADIGAAGIRICEAAGPAAFRYAPGMCSALAAVRPQLVHAHGIWQYHSIAADRYRCQTGTPMIISPHGMLERWALGHNALRKTIALALFQRRILEAATCFHALTAGEVDDIRALGLKQPVAVIPNAVAIPELADLGQSASAERVRKRLVFVGRLHRKKGLPAAIEAWRLLKAADPTLASRWTFCICGWDDGGHEDELRRQIAECGLEKAEIDLLGPLYGAQRDALLASADAFLLASVSEGLPMSVLEAWSFEVPVFMTRACNLPDGFAAGAAIEIHPEARSICEALRRNLPRPDLGTLGAAGRRLVDQAYSWKSVCTSYVDLYRWLLGGPEAPGFVHV